MITTVVHRDKQYTIEHIYPDSAGTKAEEQSAIGSALYDIFVRYIEDDAARSDR